MPLQWRKQFWQSLEEGAGKRCSECASSDVVTCSVGDRYLLGFASAQSFQYNNDDERKHGA